MRCVFLISLLLTATTATADLATDLQTIVADFLAENPSAPGVSAWVVCPALGLDWSGAAGFADRDSDEPLTPAPHLPHR